MKELKIRIRWYGNTFGKIISPVLEIKTKQHEYGKKITYPVKDFPIGRGLTSKYLFDVLSNSNLPEVIGTRDHWSIRLPHEWEWQWAVGGGSTVAAFPSGDSDPSKCNLKEAGIGRSIAVGLYPDGAAACGAMDVIGNVREWTGDQARMYEAEPVVDPVAHGSRPNRVFRGCSYRSYSGECRAASRWSSVPEGPFLNEHGLRSARSLP